METFGTMMSRLDLKVASPDRRIHGRIQGRDRIDIVFRGNAYREYTEDAMGAQLGGLFQLMWTGYRRATLMAMARTMGEASAEEGRHPTDPEDRDLFEERRTMKLAATSVRGFVKVRCVGWRDWSVRIEPGTCDDLTEEEFRTELLSLVPPLMDRYRHKSAELADNYFRRVDPEGHRRMRDLERRWSEGNDRSGR